MEQVTIIFESENLKVLYFVKEYVILTPSVSIKFDLLCSYKVQSTFQLNVSYSNVLDTHYLNIELNDSELKQFLDVLDGIIEKKANSLKKYGFEIGDFSIVNDA